MGLSGKFVDIERYSGSLPYFHGEKLRIDHEYRIYEQRKFFQKHCCDLVHPKVLDLGCNDGRIIDLITRGYAPYIVGIDILPDEAYTTRSYRVDSFVSDISEGLPIQPDSMDLVVAGEIIEHLYSPENLMKEVNRILVPGGGLIISTPNICSLRNRLRILDGRFPVHHNSSSDGSWGDHIRIFTLNSISGLLGDNGFDVISTSSNGLYGKGMFGRLFPSLGDILVVYAKKGVAHA